MSDLLELATLMDTIFGETRFTDLLAELDADREAFDNKKHLHVCPGCDNEWEHAPVEMESAEECVEAHTCKTCGTEVWNRYELYPRRFGIDKALPREVRMQCERMLKDKEEPDVRELVTKWVAEHPTQAECSVDEYMQRLP